MFDWTDVEDYLAHLRGKGLGHDLTLDAALPPAPAVRTWSAPKLQLALLRSGRDVWLESRSIHPVFGITPMEQVRDPAVFKNFILGLAAR